MKLEKFPNINIPCIYLPELSEDNNSYSVPSEEIKHIKAFRVKSDDLLFATNGKGLFSVGLLKIPSKNTVLYSPEIFKTNYAELDFPLAVGVSVLDNKDRFELIIEKMTELGCSEIFPLICSRTQKRTINITRLNAKAISAIKQVKRSNLPIIHTPVKFDKLFPLIKNYQRIILTDIEGQKPENLVQKLSTFLLIGPEGGLTDAELAFVKKDPRTIAWNLGTRWLRAETAAIVAAGFASV